MPFITNTDGMPQSLRAKIDGMLQSGEGVVNHMQGPSLDSVLPHPNICSVSSTEAQTCNRQPCSKSDLVDLSQKQQVYRQFVDYDVMVQEDIIKDKIVPWLVIQMMEEFGDACMPLLNMICSKMHQVRIEQN